ncbi:MAG: phosphohydrolase, partial [Planctomycetota bacterium]
MNDELYLDRPVHGWMQTIGGRQFFPGQPDPGAIDIMDIAWSLSMLCRFNGHCSHFYSVAQHSVLVSQLCPPGLELAGLLHDAAEAYIGDLVAPIKREIPVFRELEERLLIAIGQRFNIDPALLSSDQVKYADRILLATEKRDLLGPEPWPWHPL